MQTSVSRIVVVALFLSLCLSGIVAMMAPFASAATPPDAPTNLSVNSGNRTLTLYWASYSSTFNGGSAIDSIAIHYGTAPGARTNVTTASGTATSCLFNNLTLGQRYYFAVRAHNSVGWSPESREVNATFAGFPYAPRNLTISYSGTATSMATANISWEAPLNTGGTPLTHYVFSVSHKIGYHLPPYYTWTYDIYATVDPDVTSYVVDSLVRGGSYSVRVEAYNAVGYSSTYLLTVPPATTPGAPTNLRAVPNYGQVTLYWDASDGRGSTILGYYVRYGDSPTNLSTNVSAGTYQYCTISGLTVGVEYYFSVQAYNSLGWSPESPVISATPIARTVPSAPTSVEATGTSNGLVYLSWRAPDNNGGYSVNEYAIRYSTEPGGVGTTISVGMATLYEGEYWYHLSDFTPGQNYYFAVLSHNLLGWSVESSEVSIMYARAPSVPQDLQITYSGDNPSYTMATMSWEAPVSNGGRPITNYTVDVGKWYYSQYGSYYSSLFHGVFGPNVTSCVMELPRGVINYTCGVEAANEAGYSNETYILVTTPCSAPAPPGYIVYPGYNQATLRIYPPTPPANGGTSMDSYMVIYGTAPGDLTYNVTIVANPSSYNDYIFNLTENETIYCVVLAHNYVGWSVASSEIVVTSLRTTPVEPSPPTSVTTIRGDGIVAVVWYPPTDNGGRSIDSYSILYGTSPGAPSVNLSVGLPYNYVGSQYFAYQVTGLINGQTYYFTVLAHNEIGWSTGSAEVSCTPAVKPTAPQNVTITYSGSSVLYGSATIEWDQPSSDGGSAITGYFLDIGYSYQPVYNQPYRWYSMYHISLDPSVTSVTVIDMLPRGSAYPIEARVYANNSVGSTSISTPIVAPAVAPAAPTSLTATPSYENITLSWPRPSNGGAGIDYYSILYGTSPDDLIYSVNVTATLDNPLSYRINGLDVGTTYYFVVKAHNTQGWSPESSVASSIFPTVPSEPMYLDVLYIESDSALASALVYWEEPAFDGGAPLVRYRATVGFWHSTGYHYEYNGVLDPSTLSFIVHNLSRGCTYEVRIVADGLVASSIAETTFTPPVIAPGAPHDLQVVPVGEDSVMVRWGYAAENGAPIDQYKICYGSATGSWTVEVIGGQPYTDVPITGLDSGWAYYFVVLAHNSAGWSAPSNEVSVVLVPSSDNVPPDLISCTPPDGSTGVSTSVSIVLCFSEAMNKSSMEGAFLLLLNAQAVPGTFAWSEGDTVCTFTPNSLSVSSIYATQMVTGATDVAGNPLPSFTFSFTTEEDTTPPVTTITLGGTLDAYGYYINNVTISFSAVDAHSSVDHIEYSLDGTTWLSYTGPFLSTTKGQYYIYYRSEDNWGNLESSQSTLISVAGIIITSPTASSVWTVSTTNSSGANVQYVTMGTIGESFQFDLYKDGAFIKTIGFSNLLFGKVVKIYHTTWTQGLVSGNDYQIKVRSTSNSALWTMSEVFTIVVLPPPQAPAALFEAPSITNFATVSFDASASHSEDSPPGTIQVRWDWNNDGVWDTAYSSELVALHTFSGGPHIVALQVLDSNGLANTTSHSVYVDVTLPSVSLTPSGTMGTNGWYISSVGITLSAADNYGVASVMYKVDNGAWTAYTGALNIALEGSHTVYGRATDLVGNQYTAQLVLKIDTVAPIIEGAPTTSPNANGWYNYSVTIHFLASDGGSGLAMVTSDQLVTIEGYDIRVTGTATDQAGNSATFTVININIDKTGPRISAGRLSPNSNGWYNAAVTAYFTATDVLSSPTIETYSFTFSGEGAGQSHTWGTTDQAGNWAQYTVSSINIDLTAPTGYADPTTSPNGNGWYNADVEMAFRLSDALSGISGSSNPTVVVGTEGTSITASVIATDLAGNTANIYSPAIKLDKTAPTGSASADRPANSNGWYNADVTIAFTVDDGLSGIDLSRSGELTSVISIEGVAQTRSATIYDLAGNSVTISSPAISIDKTAPSGYAYPTTEANSYLWYNNDVTMRFVFTDALSGIAGSLIVDVIITGEGALLDVSCDMVDRAGNRATVWSPQANIDRTAPSGSWLASSSPNSNGWYSSDVTMELLPGADLSGLDIDLSDPLSQVISSEGVGRTVTITLIDLAGNSASFTSPAVNLDKTAPAGSATPTSAPNEHGWYNTDVTMLFALTDGLSGIDGALSPTAVITAEGQGVVGSVTVADLAGNTATIDSPAVNVDKTSPTGSALPSTSPNAQGWYTSDVVIDITASDALSGLDGSYDESMIISTEGTSQTVSITVKDLAGNSAYISSPAISVDKTAPTGSAEPTTFPNLNGWHKEDVTMVFTVDGGASGFDATRSDGLEQIIIAEGSAQTVSVTVYDNAGNWAVLTSPSIKLDKTAPEISGSPTTEPNANGWWRTDVTIDFEATDTLSGLDTVTSDVTVITEGKDQAFVGQATDLAGNIATVEVKVSIDKTVPDGSAQTTTLPNLNGWYNSDVVMQYSLSDALSGIAGLVEPTVVVNMEGEAVTEEYLATDLAGNTATIVSPSINLDKTAPVITGFPTTAPTNGWYNYDVVVHFTATDLISGVDSITADVILSEGADQSATGIAVDAAGNSATFTVTDINVDKTAPTGSGYAVSGPNEAGWYNTDVTMSFSLADSLSGIDGAEETQAVISEEGASITISVVATDLAGNTAVVISPAVSIDKTAPIIDGAPLFTPNVNGWYNDNVTIRFEASDGLSGLLVVAWDIVVSTEGAGQEVIQSVTDLAGNVASFTMGGINLDKTAPTMTGEPTTAANAHGWYSGDVTVHFTATDGLSGVVAVPEDVVVTGEGSSLVARATVLDIAGNSASLDVPIKIDRVAPTTALYIGGVAYDGTGATTINGTASFTLAAADGLSGVNEIRYLVDDEGWVLYSGPFELTTGEHTMTYRSIDQAGNVESEQQVTVKVIAVAGENTTRSGGAEMIIIVIAVVAAGAGAGVFLLKRRKP